MPDGETCPGCGRASVRLLQCGWLVAVRACDQPDCLHPLLGPVRPVARSYTELEPELASEQQQQQQPQKHSETPSDPSAVAELIATLSCNLAATDSSGGDKIGANSTVMINAEDVFIRCWLSSAGAAASAAVAISLFSRSPGGPLQRHRAAYKRCLRTVRALFRLSTAAKPDAPSRLASCCSYRGLTLDAEMLAAVDKELAALDAGLAKETAGLLPPATGSSGEVNLLYDWLRGLFRYCARTGVCLKQMCTVCFQQSIERSHCTVLRLTRPAADFDLAQPLKRVLLRPCRQCGAPDQRVLIGWEPPANGHQAAILIESPYGIPVGEGASLSFAPLVISGGIELTPTALIERRRSARSRDPAYVAWLNNAESERWMPMAFDSRFACYEDAQPPTGQEPDSDIVAVLYERLSGGAAPQPPPDSTSDAESVESLDQCETVEPYDQPKATVAPHALPVEVASATAPAATSLRHRLEEVIRSRRRHNMPLSACASPRPPTVDSVGDSFVMSRFLDVVATTAAAAAASASGLDAARRRHSRRHRLRGYAESHRQQQQPQQQASAAAGGATPAPSSESGGETFASDEFDILSLFV